MEAVNKHSNARQWRIVCASLCLIAFTGNIGNAAVNPKHNEVSGCGHDPNVSAHLGVVGRINLGSFYTPAKYVALVGTWLLEKGINEEWTIADISSGYGAFFELQSVKGLDSCRFVGNDIDAVAVSKGREMFPLVEWSVENALKDVSRKKFRFSETEQLVVVGNPPYNDVTSQIGQDVKSSNMPIDSDIKTRDLGLSSLLSYNKLKASYVAVLHPLSYLIKKSNFRAAERFFANYTLENHIVFSSQEFAGTSRVAGFPVIVALYKRNEGHGLTYADVRRIKFRTVEGQEFSMDGFDYVTDHIEKYPHKKRFEKEILFYTMRDINALKRSRTFIKNRIPNAVDVDPDKLAYYCYVDCFKAFADIPYYMGNFNVPFDKETFAEIADDVVAISRSRHPEVFGEAPNPPMRAEERVRSYMKSIMKN